MVGPAVGVEGQGAAAAHSSWKLASKDWQGRPSYAACQHPCSLVDARQQVNSNTLEHGVPVGLGSIVGGVQVLEGPLLLGSVGEEGAAKAQRHSQEPTHEPITAHRSKKIYSVFM